MLYTARYKSRKHTLNTKSYSFKEFQQIYRNMLMLVGTETTKTIPPILM